MNLFNDPLFNSILTGIIVYSASVLSNSGFSLLGSILATFPIGIMAMLSIKGQNLLDNFIQNILIANSIIVLMWFIIYYNSSDSNPVSLATIGLTSWSVFSFIYFLYISQIKN